MATNAARLLEKLSGLGAVLEPRGNRLAIRFPEARRAEVERLRPEVVRLKPELLRALEEQPAGVVPPAPAQPETCWH